jgi:KDO2-lipid IV(A) lauroyltransferase
MPPPRETPENRPLLKRVRHRLEWLTFVTLSWLVPLLPRRVAVVFARFLGSTWYFLDARSRHVAHENLRVALPECPGPSRILRESFQNTALTALDVFWSRRLTTANLPRHIDIDPSWQHVVEAIGEGKGVICIAAHFGNFEWILHAFALQGVRGTVVVQELKNPLLSGLYNRLRSRTGVEVVTRHGGMLNLFRRLRQGRNVGILIDLTLHASIPSVVVDFFGLKTNVTFLHAMLHQRTRAPIVPVACLPTHHGRCRFVAWPRLVFPEEATLEQMTAACLAQLESRIRETPALWLWAYKHWRYRESANPGFYPDYANVSSLFEKKLARQGRGHDLVRKL